MARETRLFIRITAFLLALLGFVYYGHSADRTIGNLGLLILWSMLLILLASWVSQKKAS